MSLDLWAAIGVGGTTAVMGSLLPTVARRAGLDPLGLAVLASVPFLANFLGMLSGRIGPHTTLQLAVSRGLGAGMLILLVVVPGSLPMVLVALVFWLSFAFGLPLQLRLWGAMYPGRLRGRLLGVLGTGRAAAGGVALLVCGVLADRIGGPEAVAIIGVFGALCAGAVLGLRAPVSREAPHFSARASLRALRSHPVLRQASFAQLFYGGGLIAAAPLYALVQVDRLSLSLSDVGIIGLIASLATTVSYVAWGALADRRGGSMLLRGGSILGALSLVVYAVAPGVVWLWLAALAIGLANSGTDIGLQSVMMENAPSDERAAVMAGFNALTGVRGMAVPFVASGLVEAGVVSVTGALLLCAVATGIGAWLYFRLGTQQATPVSSTLRRLVAQLRA